MRRPTRRYGRGREAHPKGQEVQPEVWKGGPPVGLGIIGRPNRKSGRGR